MMHLFLVQFLWHFGSATRYAQGDVDACYPLTQALPRSYDDNGNPFMTRPNVENRSAWWCSENELSGFISLAYPHVGDCTQESADAYKVIDTDMSTISATGAVLIDFGPRLDGCTQESLYYACFYAAFHSLGIKLTLSKNYANLKAGFDQAVTLLESLEDMGTYMIYSVAPVDFRPDDLDTFDIGEFLKLMETISTWSEKYLIPLEFKAILGQNSKWTSRATDEQLAQLEALVAYWDYKADIVEDQCLDAEASAQTVLDVISALTVDKPTTITASWITHAQKTINRDALGKCKTDNGFYKCSPEDAAIFLSTLGDCKLWSASGMSFNAGQFSDENGIGLGLYGNRTDSGICEPYVAYSPEICHMIGSSTTTPFPRSTTSTTRGASGNMKILSSHSAFLLSLSLISSYDL